MPRTKTSPRRKRVKRVKRVASSVARRVDEISGTDLKDGLLWIVVFGPGEGEAVVVRLPDGRVGVVDGCRDRSRGCPVHRLLTSLGPPGLFFACLTHPHEDHYQGLAQVLADVRGRVDHVWHVISLAANEQKALIRYAKAFCKSPRNAGVGDTGTWKKMDLVYREMMRARSNVSTPKRAKRKELVTELPMIAPEKIDGEDFEIVAWGPSHEDKLRAKLRFLGGKRSRTDDLPNTVSGALLVRWGAARVLLAGDLYQNADDERGWGPARELAKKSAPVQVVNVAHHASENAHDDALWNAMSPSFAIVTPFRNASLSGTKPLMPPRPSDISRLLRSCEVAITSEPRWLGRKLVPKAPQRRNVKGKVAKPPAPPLAASPLLGPAMPSTFDDARNAVAVALDKTGRIVEVILGGQSDFYR